MGEAGQAPATETRRTWPALAALAVWLPTAAALTLAGRVPRMLQGGLDSWVGHVGIGFAVTLSVLLALRSAAPEASPSTRAKVLAATLVFLAGTELAQGFTSTRSPQTSDLVADLAGAGIAAGLIAVIGRRTDGDRIQTLASALALVAAVVLVVGLVALPDPDPEPRPGPGPGPGWTTWRCIDRSRAVERSPLDESPDRPPDHLLLVDLSTGQPATSGLLGSIPFEIVGSPEPADGGLGLGLADDGEALRWTEPAAALTTALGRTQAFTIDVSLTLTEADQTGPARIVTVSDGLRPANISFQLGVNEGRLSLRIRSQCHGSVRILLGEVPTTPTHLVVSYDRGQIVVYRDDGVIARFGLIDPDLTTWDPAHHLVIGNEATLNRPVRASIRCVGIHDRALPEDEALALSAQARC